MVDFTGTTDLADIEQIHIYSTGSEARSTQRKELFGNGHTPEQSLTLRPTHGEEILLQPGINYFLLTFDVRSKATPGHTLYASVPFFKLNGKKIIPETSAEEVLRVKLCNEDYLLKPGMFTTVNVECKSSGKQMPRINAHALIFEGGKNYVVTVTPDNRLKVKEVDVYKRQNQECYVRSGLSEGDRVLNQNVLLVYNSLNAD